MGDADIECGTDEILRESVAAIKKGYDEFESMKELHYEFLNDHSEIAPGVFRSVFSNGTQIICNYSEANFEYSGQTIGPMNYAVLKK